MIFLKNIRSKFFFLFKAISMISIIVLMVYGVFVAIEDKKHELALGILSVCFVFVFLFSRDFKIKSFTIGGKFLGISVNQKGCDKDSSHEDSEIK